MRICHIFALVSLWKVSQGDKLPHTYSDTSILDLRNAIFEDKYNAIDEEGGISNNLPRESLYSPRHSFDTLYREDSLRNQVSLNQKNYLRPSLATFDLIESVGPYIEGRNRVSILTTPLDIETSESVLTYQSPYPSVEPSITNFGDNSIPITYIPSDIEASKSTLTYQRPFLSAEPSITNFVDNSISSTYYTPSDNGGYETIAPIYKYPSIKSYSLQATQIVDSSIPSTYHTPSDNGDYKPIAPIYKNPFIESDSLQAPQIVDKYTSTNHEIGDPSSYETVSVPISSTYSALSSNRQSAYRDISEAHSSSTPQSYYKQPSKRIPPVPSSPSSYRNQQLGSIGSSFGGSTFTAQNNQAPPSYQDSNVQSKYAYEYSVETEDSHYGHSEAREGSFTAGEYFVALPDGRTQRVTYFVDRDKGFVPFITYEGEVTHPSYSTSSKIPAYY